MNRNIQRGFTLIELLIVIAIIGILSATVLVALNDARAKSRDAATKRMLTEIRTQSELYHAANARSYLNLCASGTVGGVERLQARLLELQTNSGAASLAQVASAAGLSNRVTCHASASEWAVEAPLLSATAMVCIDSEGRVMQTAASTLPANDYACGP